MNDQLKSATAATVQDIRKTFEGIAQDMERRDSAFERKALRNYLLHTLLGMTGRLDELFAYDTAVADPEYVFFDTGTRIRGRDAIVAFHREQMQRGTSLCVPVDQRVAFGPWGFAGEQTMHNFLPGGRLERVRSALVWRCDEAGRMKSLRFYPAAQHETVALEGPLALDAGALATSLSPLVSRIKSIQ